MSSSEDQLLEEHCDKTHRALRCEVIDRAGRSPKNTETTWQWKPVLTRNGRMAFTEAVVRFVKR